MRVNYNELNLAYQAISDIVFLKDKNLWIIFSQENESYYFGAFYNFYSRPFKFIHKIFLPKIKEINILNSKEAIFDSNNNSFYLKVFNDEIEIKCLNFDEIRIILDANFIFNENPFLRKIKIERINSNCLHVLFIFENKLILESVFESSSPLNFFENWERFDLNFDKKRNSKFQEFWYLNGIETKSNFLRIKILNQQSPKENLFFNYTNNNYYNFLISRLNALIINNYLPAGFPWFYENWFRDELISFYLLKNFLNYNFKPRYFSNFKDWMFLNKPNGFEASDTFLWFLINLDKNDYEVYQKLIKEYLEKWENRYLKENLLNLPPKTTWMDTLERKEALEIYALYLKTLRNLAKLDNFYKEKANFYFNLLKNKVNEIFDVNLIFVYLLIPDLFEKKEWLDLFDKLIKNFYLLWGGISSKKINEENFYQNHTGENPLSYHCGDSWYYLNNLLALCLFLLDRKKYNEIISKIILSSLEDLLKDGVLGYSSELSSAQIRKSEGSLIQTWSIASLLFLLFRLQDFDIFFKSLSD